MKTFTPFLLIVLVVTFANAISSHKSAAHSALNLRAGISQNYADANPTDSNVQDSQEYGLQEVIKSLQSQKAIPNNDIYVTSKVNSIQQKSSGGVVTYKFDVELNNNKGIVVQATYEVVNSRSGRSLGNVNVKILKSSSVTIPKAVESSYTIINIREIQTNAKLRVIYSFGWSFLLKSLVQQNLLSGNNWQVSRVVSASQQTAQGFAFYKFVISVENDDGATAVLTFVVTENLSTGERSVNPSTNGDYISALMLPQPKPIESAWTTINVNDVQANGNKRLWSIFSYGWSYLSKFLVDQKVLTGTNWQVSQIVSAWQQSLQGFSFYKFVVSIQNDDGVQATLTFIVIVDGLTGERTIIPPSSGQYISNIIQPQPKPLKSDLLEPVYRYWSIWARDHFYYNGAGIPFGYVAEGIEFCTLKTQVNGSMPFYRFYSPSWSDHFYTADQNEVNWAVSSGFNREGDIGNIFTAETSMQVRNANGTLETITTVPIHRYWNGGIQDHFYTTYFGHIDNWAYDKVVGHAFKTC